MIDVLYAQSGPTMFEQKLCETISISERARNCTENMSPDIACCIHSRSLKYVFVLQKYVYEVDRRS
jgi:hypothetical protein